MNLDRWFLKHVEVSVRKGPRGDKTADCVDERFLESYAEEPTEFSLADDRVEHVVSCSYCMGCLLELRATRQARGSWGVHYIAVACLGRAIIIGDGIIAFVLHHCRSAAAFLRPGELRRTLDLSQHFTAEARLSLPAALMSVEIWLPEMSQPGVYGIAVLNGGKSGDCVAQTECKCKSTHTKPRAVGRARLDLRKAVPGSYLLSTQCKGQSATQIYPLEIGPLMDRRRPEITPRPLR